MALKITAAKIGSAIRRLEKYVATKQFQAAIAALEKDQTKIAAAKRDPKRYLAGFGIALPEGYSAEIRVVKPGAAAAGKAARAMSAEVHFCITVCTEDGCYTLCVRFRIPFLSTASRKRAAKRR